MVSIAWAKLVARAREEFPLQCPACGGDIRLPGDGRQAHDDRDVFQVSPDGLPVIDIHTLSARTDFLPTRESLASREMVAALPVTGRSLLDGPSAGRHTFGKYPPRRVSGGVDLGNPGFMMSNAGV
jgi:hypothetical protein